MKNRFFARLCLVSILLWLLAIVPTAFAQTEKRMVYTVVERQPEFPGGSVALSRYLAATIKVPNALARRTSNTGPVAAKFIIDELGYIHDVRVTIKPLDKKARRGMEAFMANIIAAVEKMPRWEPGEVDGKHVAVFYTLPIEVNLQ